MKREADEMRAAVGGLAGWFLSRLRHDSRHRQPRLELLERIALAPRQSLALVEAEGRRFLVATSPEGAPAFYALEERGRQAAARQAGPVRPAARVSW
jgi:flagellar biogenesis protein FliO